MRSLLITGGILLAISAPPLALMVREVAIGSAINARYSVESIDSPEKGMEGGALQAEIGGHRVVLRDDQPFNLDGDARVPGLVRVVVDGRAQPKPVPATIRLASQDANRYWGYVRLIKLVDHQEGVERLVVAQNLGGDQYRTLSVFADGRIVEDQFDYPSRCEPPIRSVLINEVVPHPSGYCSDVMQVWPSLLYPLLYPWVSGGVGALCVVVGLFKLRRRNASGEPERLDA